MNTNPSNEVVLGASEQPQSGNKPSGKQVDKLREEAKKLVDENIENLAMRSCWNCNGAHEHLKQAPYVIVCAVGCGHYYFKGVDITVNDLATERSGGDDV